MNIIKKNKKKKKIGFTLIELLAVIVILAIIALIAIPIVLNIIKDSKDSATLRSAENYMDGVANAIARTNMKEGGTFSPTSCDVKEDGNLLCDNKEITVDIDKEKPNGGSITFNKGKVVDVSLNYENGKTIVDDEKGNLVYGEPIKEAVSFGTDLWATIKANVNTGVYNVGDEKEVELDIDGDGTKTSYTLRIANLPSEEEKTEGCGSEGFSETACGFVVEFKDIITTHVMNSYMSDYYGTNKGGWPASEMRKYIGGYTNEENTFVEGIIYKSLPDDLKNVLIDTYVVSSYGYTYNSDSNTNTGTRSDGNFESTDKLYLLSTKELLENGTTNPIEYDAARDVTRQLDYYKSHGATTDNTSSVNKLYEGNDYPWWLRSAHWDYPGYFYIYGGGAVSAYYNIGVAPAFRIG